MTDNGITQLIKSAPVLSGDDTIRRAAGLIRASDGSEVLVANGGRVLGTVSEKDITDFLAKADDPSQAMNEPISPLTQESPLFINASVSLNDAVRVFSTSGADVLAVIDSFGAYRGVLYRRDVIGVLTNNLRPPSVAGMATPLGVYLTSGSLSGGAGSMGLYLTGVALMTMVLIAGLVVGGLQMLIQRFTGWPVMALVNSPPLTMKPNIYDLAFYLSMFASFGTYLLLLRLSPLSGYHAAEHMTVHAIEAGEVLTPDSVRGMPRVHPRCGTNLLAAAGLFIMITTKISNQFSVLIALIVVVMGWRTIGGWLQYLVTTKPPSEKQLKNGVAAGNELLQKYQQQPNFQLYGFERIWRLGFLQTFMGMTTVAFVIWVLGTVFHLPTWMVPI